MSVGDFIAMQDVLVELADESDSLSLDEAIAALEAIRNLHSEMRRCESMIETALKAHLEAGGRELGGRMYVLKADGKWRFRHDEIDRAVYQRAIQASVGESGEIDPVKAVNHAIRAMADLYRAPSTKPKTGALEKLGYEKPSRAADWEATGSRIEIIDLEGPE